MKFDPKAMVIACIVVLFFSTANVTADVAVIQPANGPAYPIVSSIIEDTDPVGAWTRTLNSVNYVHLNENGDINNDGLPNVLFDPATGRTFVAWSFNNGSDYDVVISVFDNGAWTAQLTLAGGPLNQLDPQLAIDPATGDLHIVYWEDGSNERVLHRQSDSVGQVWSSETTVSQNGDVAVRPAITFYQGQQVVAYESHNFGIEGLPKQLIVATKSGTSYSYEVLESTQRGSSNRIELHSRYGKLWVDWVDDNGSMGWKRRSGAGAWEPTQFESFSDGVDLEYNVRPRVRMQAIE